MSASGLLVMQIRKVGRRKPTRSCTNLRTFSRGDGLPISFEHSFDASIMTRNRSLPRVFEHVIQTFDKCFVTGMM